MLTCLCGSGMQYAILPKARALRDVRHAFAMCGMVLRMRFPTCGTGREYDATLCAVLGLCIVLRVVRYWERVSCFATQRSAVRGLCTVLRVARN
eukprot:899063-Rhodomonas_salina.1